MKKFDDVTQEQLELLTRLVTVYQKYGGYSFTLGIGSDQHACLFTPDHSYGIPGVPGQRVFYTGLHDLGFIAINYELGTPITMQQKAIEFVEYMKLSRAKRRWEDFKFDLDHDASFRSKVLWLLITISIGYFGQFIMRLFGVHL